MSSSAGLAKRKTVAKKTRAAWERGIWHKPMIQVSSDGAGGDYRAEGTDRE